MEERIYITNLYDVSVSVKRQKLMVVDGIEYDLGFPIRKAYSNSQVGREELEKEVPEQYVKAIFEVWGDTPIED